MHEIALLAVVDCKNFDISMTDYADEIATSRLRVTRMTAKLMERGLIKQFDYPGDRRKVELRTTAAGSAMLRALETLLTIEPA